MRSGIQGVLKILAMTRLNPVHQPVSNKIAFLITHFIAAAVRITDESGGIQHQDHALRSVQNLLIEIALALQLRLKCSLLRDVQHQATNLDNPPTGVANSGDVLQGVQQRTVFSPQGLFVISQNTMLSELRKKSLPRSRRGIQMRAHVGA